MQTKAEKYRKERGKESGYVLTLHNRKRGRGAQRYDARTAFGEVVERVICFIIGWIAYFQGYKLGRTSLLTILKSNKIEQVLVFAAVMGVFMLGAMGAQYTKLTTPLVLNISGGEYVLQDMINSLLSGLMPLRCLHAAMPIWQTVASICACCWSCSWCALRVA